jgi:hypothetical protein
MDGDLDYTTGYEFSRPKSLVCHPINEVVAKKVKSNLQYGVVFRVKKSSGRFVEDIKEYESRDFLGDINRLKQLDYVDQETLNQIVTKIKNNGIIKHYFGKFWKITEMVAESTGKTKESIWRKILLDLGYIGFNDQAGLGIFSKKKQPTTLVLNKNVEFLDVVPLQKSIKDKRNRVIDQVERQNKKLAVARKRIAKAEPSNRSSSATGIGGLIKSILGG